MKSAYELAMERLSEGEPETKTLTDAQKKALAETDQIFQAKIAEREIFLNQQIQSASDPKEIESLQTQLKNEKARLEEEREEAKNKIRNE